MDNQNGSRKNLHFVVFPWLAQGHINPFLELAKALAIHSHTVSFVSTPLNILRIRPSLKLQCWPGRIDLLELSLPPTEGLTPGAECTADIPPEMAAPLKKAMDGLEKPFRRLLEQLSPDYIVHDFVQHWTQNVAAEMRIPTVYFSVFSPVSCCYISHPSRLHKPEITAEELAKPPVGFPSSAISFRLYEARGISFIYREIPGHLSPISRLTKCLEGCAAVAVKSCFESEHKYIRHFQDAMGVPVLSVGPLMPAIQPGANSSEGSQLLEWLDGQKAASVVFVSFGSETFLRREQVRELALGLEASGLPFLWSLRSPRHSDGAGDDPLGLLPEGFESRTWERGVVVGGWVPQVRIISHPAVGGYLNHGGWGSAMEALTFGLPLVMLPMGGDQCLNARQIAAELKAGVEIERGDDGSFLAHNVCLTLKMVMKGEKGKILRSKAVEARDVLVANTARQQSYMDEFLQALEQIAEAYKNET